MTQAFRFVSGYNGFIPQATGQVINYIRQPNEFPLNDYVQLVESPSTTGIYYEVDHDQPVRLAPDGKAMAWADGAERPQPMLNLGFRAIQFFTERYDLGFALGNQALRLNTWKAFEQEMQATASIMMTWRTNQVINALQTVTNWATTNYGDANTVNGGAGFLDQASDDPSSPNYNAIRKAITQMLVTIRLQTNGKVRARDLVLVMNPDQARKLANTAEIANYLKFGPFAKDQLSATVEEGLPNPLYGLKVVIEDSPILTDLQTAGQTGYSTSRGFIKDSSSLIVCSRPGGLDGAYGARSFSTVQLFWFENQMSVWSYSDPRNLREEGHVVDQYTVVTPASVAGYLLQNCFA